MGQRQENFFTPLPLLIRGRGKLALEYKIKTLFHTFAIGLSVFFRRGLLFRPYPEARALVWINKMISSYLGYGVLGYVYPVMPALIAYSIRNSGLIFKFRQ